ncbi:MAG: hypothetical protein HQL20_01295 [Candidatus Omnitrophica bacterium]|nr:hypothetical protein [Candidatus Omnitrophota bacterium]
MLRNNKAQISMLFIVAIALGLVFMAMVMNWSEAVQFKTQAQVAATTTAATMVSRMASYGENIMQTQLEGKAQKCSQNGVLTLIIMIIIIVIIMIAFLVILPAAYGMAWGCMVSAKVVTAVTVGLTTALVLTTATVAVQLAYIQPTITSMWNKLQNNIPTVEDQYLEAAVQAAIQAVNTDTVEIPDLLDYNMNGKWNVASQPGSDPREMISRFSYHYTNRLKSVSLAPSKFDKFTEELSDFARDLGLDQGKVGTCCAESSCKKECQFQASVTIASDQTAMAWGSTCNQGPYQGFPYAEDLLRCLSSAPVNGVVTGDNTTVAALVGRERVILIDNGAEVRQAEPEQGPLFSFMWNLKAATDKSIEAHRQDPINAPMDIFDDKRVRMKYFYESPDLAGCPSDMRLSLDSTLDILRTDPGINNRWRPGDDRFCESNETPDGFYSAPHSSNCSFSMGCDTTKITTDADGNREADRVCECKSPLVTDQKLWKGDRFDQMVNNLRNTSMVMRAFDTPYAEQVFMVSPDMFAQEFNDAMANFRMLKRDFSMINGMLTSSEVTTGFTLVGEGTVELQKAADNAAVFVNNFDVANQVFFCETARDPDLCAEKMGTANDRLAYLQYLFEEARKIEDVVAISPYVIYGWQAAAQTRDRGYRHVVKVEVATPKRCEWWSRERGGVARSCGAVKFPWVKSEKSGEMGRCYTLTDGNGCVKVRITRWDENRISKALTFVGGLPFWGIFTGHPANEMKPPLENLEACFNHDKVEIGGQPYYIPTSFMINKGDDYTNKYGLDCADAVQAAIRQGYVTEVCAEYFVEDNSYRMRYIKCNEACPTH